MWKIVLVILMLLVVIIASGCGMINGFCADVENASRWGRERSQKSVDNMELRRIRAGIDAQNRIVVRGRELAGATR